LKITTVPALALEAQSNSEASQRAVFMRGILGALPRHATWKCNGHAP
jgi:hypothetical protein